MSDAERWVVLGLMGADLLVIWVAVRVSDRRARRVARGRALAPHPTVTQQHDGGTAVSFETVDVSPGNGTRYELVIGIVGDRLLVAWPEVGAAGWFPLHDCVPTYLQSKLRVGFGDGVAIRNIICGLGYWDTLNI